MRMTWVTLVDRLRVSLFFVPMLGVVVAIGLGELMLGIDRAIGTGQGLPLVLTSTVESGRTVLSTIATATMAVAGIAFSVSLLIIQQASGQFSPRVVHGLFRDPFNRRVMAVAVGTFTYSLVVLRAVRSPEDSGTEVVVPNISIAVAVLLGIAAILAIVAFISHNAHSMEVSEILHRVLVEAMATTPEVPTEGSPRGTRAVPEVPDSAGHLVRADADGWIQRVDTERMLCLVDAGGVVRMETGVGRFVFAGSPLCTVWGGPDDPESLRSHGRDAVRVGASRTIQQDPAYGLRQLADVALKALSPGVNDPTTAQDAMFHAGALLSRLLAAPPERVHRDGHGRVLILPHTATPAELVGLTFAEVRQAAAPLPDVCVYLLECMHLVRRTLEEHPVDPTAVAAIDEQARLTVVGCEHAELLPEDMARVRAAHRRLLGTASPVSGRDAQCPVDRAASG
jgi:uncharacterized membrane protein